MKNIFITIALSLALFSCSNESKIKSGITDYMDKNAKDPKSFEIVEVKMIDTVTPDFMYKYKTEKNKTLIEIANRSILNMENKVLPQLNDDNSKYPGQFNDLIKEANDTIADNTYTISEASKENTKLKIYKGKNDAFAYVAKCKYRIKNGFGALDLKDDYFVFDKELHVINMQTPDNPYSEITEGYFYQNFINKK